MAKKRLPATMWAAFIDGKMDVGAVVDAMYGYHGMLFETKRSAQRMYSDVRRVRVLEAKKPAKEEGNG